MTFLSSGSTVNLLNQKQVAAMLCMSEAWLEQCRFKGIGVPFVKIGRAVRYRLGDVQEYINSRVQRKENGDGTI